MTLSCTHAGCQVDFPGLGRLFTNKAGRIDFVFDSLLMEYFEREHYALIKEVSSPSSSGRARHVWGHPTDGSAAGIVTLPYYHYYCIIPGWLAGSTASSHNPASRRWSCSQRTSRS